MLLNIMNEDAWKIRWFSKNELRAGQLFFSILYLIIFYLYHQNSHIVLQLQLLYLDSLDIISVTSYIPLLIILVSKQQYIA